MSTSIDSIVRAQTKVDVHHHMVPAFYAEGIYCSRLRWMASLTDLLAVAGAGGDPSGFPTPQWSPAASLALMEKVQSKTAILSITAPGPCILQGQASRDLARQSNEYAAKLRDENPSRFGFFASVPSLLDTEAAIAEITYALDVLHADGVTLFTRYGHGEYVYLGHPKVQPIWAELDKRHAVVFIHPTHPVDTHSFNPRIPQPIIDYPHETTRTAVDMIMSNTKRKHPNCKVILSHAGGTLPYLITRISVPLQGAPSPMTTKSSTEVMEDAQSFYYDLALSSSRQVLNMLLDFVLPSHILYGSDFPYAPTAGIVAFNDELDSFGLDDTIREQICFKNAETLFPRLKK